MLHQDIGGLLGRRIGLADDVIHLAEHKFAAETPGSGRSRVEVVPLRASVPRRQSQRRLPVLVLIAALAGFGFDTVPPSFWEFGGALDPPLHGVSGVVSGVTVTL